MNFNAKDAMILMNVRRRTILLTTNYILDIHPLDFKETLEQHRLTVSDTAYSLTQTALLLFSSSRLYSPSSLRILSCSLSFGLLTHFSNNLLSATRASLSLSSYSSNTNNL